MQQQLRRLLIQRPIILQILKFGAIGVINTAIDFIILNFASKTFGIESGLGLGGINVLGFIAATIQSYFWNRYWTFGVVEAADVLKNFWRLVVVGGVGAGTVIAVILGAQANAAPAFYLVVLAVFALLEAAIWIRYEFAQHSHVAISGQQFVAFVVVSLIGLIINSAIISIVSVYLVNLAFFQSNADLLKNVAKILATGISLIWNFIGYKLIVFKK